MGAAIEMARLEDEVNELSGKLESRKLIERAKGILQSELDISEEQAYAMLQKEARDRRISMKDVAEAVLLSNDLRRARKFGGADKPQ